MVPCPLLVSARCRLVSTGRCQPRIACCRRYSFRGRRCFCCRQRAAQLKPVGVLLLVPCLLHTIKANKNKFIDNYFLSSYLFAR